MKHFKIFACAAVCMSLMFSGCGSSTGLSSFGSGGNSSSSSTSSSGSTSSYVLDVVNSLLGNYTGLKEKDLYGTWNYTGTDCRFKSENFLKQAGGEVAAKEIESQLDNSFQKIGIKPGASSFTFNQDKTFSAKLGVGKLSGTYTFDEATKTMKLTYLMGLGNIDASVQKSGSSISLLFDADKILGLLNTVASMTNNTTLKTINTLANQYDGLLLGMEMSK